MLKGINVHAERESACMHLNKRDQRAYILMKGISVHAF